MNILEKIISESQKEIYLKYASLLPPFDVVGFGKELGLEIKESNQLPAKVSGFIKETDNQVSICVNQLDSLNRKRFTIAHELGHYFLHSDKLKSGIIDGVDTLNRDGRADPIEYEANKFAADLLMPEELFRELWSQENSSITSMSGIFSVSESAIAIRAKTLGLAQEDYYYFA